MAHLIESMAYYGETPWHKLGVQALNAMTAEEAIIKGGLNWLVEKKPIQVVGGQEIEEVYATVRDIDQKPLGVVGKIYQPLQNHEAFRFFDPFVSSKEAMFHTVGSLDGGRKIWILAKLPKEIRVLGEDITEQYLLIANSHDASSQLEIKFTPIRVVCNNTLTAAINGRGLSYKIRHTTNIADRVHEASKAMGIASVYFQELNEALNTFTKVEMKQSQVREYLERCLQIDQKAPDERSSRVKNQLAALENLIETGAGTDIPGVRGTLYGAYNAVTEWVDHKSYRNEDLRLENAWFSGSGQQTKQRAFDLAVALAR